MIVYKDDDIVVVHKRAGTLSEGDSSDALPVLLSVALAECGEKNTDIFPVHRLDRETEGVMVYARTKAAAAALSEAVRERGMKKQYLAVVCGVPSEPSGTLCDLLYFDRARGKSFVVARERKGVKGAELDYTVVSTHDGMSLLRIDLHTGRTHQIRAQFSSRGLPLVGDRRYGAPKSEFSGIALFSCSISFPHPKTKKQMHFELQVPETSPWNFFI